MILLKKQQPDLDIRMVFQRNNKIKESKVGLDYVGWCEKNGFLCSVGFIPNEWLNKG